MSSASLSVPIPAAGIGSRISAACERLGTRKNAASLLGVSVDSLARYIREENTPPFDVAARLCLASGQTMEWLATGIEPPAPVVDAVSQDLSLETLKLAVQTVEEARQIADLSLSPEKAGEVVSLVYQLLCSGLAEAEIIPITRQALNVAKGDAVDAGRSKAASSRQAAGGNR